LHDPGALRRNQERDETPYSNSTQLSEVGRLLVYRPSLQLIKLMTSSVQALQFFNYVLDVGRITFRLISTSQHRLLTQHEPRSALAHTHHFSLKQSADHSHNYRNVMNIIIGA